MTTTKVREQFQFESSAMMIENGGVMIEEGFEMTTVGVGGVTSGISPTAAEDAMSSYFDPRFPKSISIVLLVVGVFGNSLCLFIFSRKHMRRNSTFVYLAFLACVDLFVLTLGLSDIILISYLNFVLRNQALFVCRFVSFLIYSFTHLSSFILASVSIDRAIATNFITYSKTYCRPITAYKVIGFNIFLAVIINFHNLLFMGHISHTRIGDENGSSIDYVSSNNRSNGVGNGYPLSSSTSSGGVAESGTMVVQVICESKKDTIYDAFIDPYYKWIDLLAYAIIPFIIMLICTFLIVRVLFRSNRRLNKNRTPAHSNKKSSQHQQQPKEEGVLILKKDQSANSGVNAAAISNSLLTISASNTQLNNNNSPTYNKDQNANSTTMTTNRNSGVVNIKSSANKPITPASAAASRASKAKHLTYTLIILNCLFFCLVGPLLIVLVTYSDQMIANNKILLNIVYLLAYANHTFNFVLYGFSSPPFRTELFRILRINQQPSNAATAAAAQQNPPINIKRV